MDRDEICTNLEQLIRGNGDDFASISRMLGKNPAYIQQFIRRGTPKKLDEEDRHILAEYYDVDVRMLGGMGAAAPRHESGSGADMTPISRLSIGASAGAGSLSGDGLTARQDMGFSAAWLKKMGVRASQLSMISVDGDSMEPALCDGDDILVDHGAVHAGLRDGIYVLRMDDVLLVKRISPGPHRKISVRSDNPEYPNWEDMDAATVDIIGRVIWTGKRL